MSTRYDNFDVFLADVLGEARQRADRLRARWALADPAMVGVLVTLLLGPGFWSITAMAFMLALGWFGLVIEVPLLLATPLGMALAVAFGTAAASIIWRAWEDRRFVEAVADLGGRMQPRWESLRRDGAGNEAMDALFWAAVGELT